MENKLEISDPLDALKSAVWEHVARFKGNRSPSSADLFRASTCGGKAGIKKRKLCGFACSVELYLRNPLQAKKLFADQSLHARHDNTSRQRQPRKVLTHHHNTAEYHKSHKAG
ncbi:unnamed protein product [Pleuronectes platessa]|uniref:Uncharacterized protein n=1 Tax=Pleuronectes platessa TaxID=8262 RepID=A0A9N7UAU9_PLEPL|nr:unnamed protein product [Pleuronectes platessa]